MPSPIETSSSGPQRRPKGDRVVWVAGVMIATGMVLCFAALLNL